MSSGGVEVSRAGRPLVLQQILRCAVVRGGGGKIGALIIWHSEGRS